MFLKTSRLILRRSLAQEFCDAGLIEVNGAQSKSSKEIKPGDEIAIKRRNRITRVTVTAVPEKKQVSKADAGDLYNIIADEAIADSLP